MPYEDYMNLSDADYENLPPLVPVGEDREAILNRVVQAWADAPDDLGDFDSLEQHPTTLRRIDLRDDNENAAPIDLADLIRRAIDAAAGHTIPNVYLLGCRIRSCNAEGLDIPGAFYCPFCQFSADTDFINATFSADADFTNARFRANASFRIARFRADASFRDATFSANAYFRIATFSANADFTEARFRADADFRFARFRADVDFRFARFRADANFSTARFSADANFIAATFSANAYFRVATFSGVVHLRHIDLRTSELQSISQFLRRRSRSSRWMNRCFGWLHWRWVRNVGQLQALTRASYWALLLVPIIAAVWPAARSAINVYNHANPDGPLPETLPLSWLLAFSAALAVALGHFFYQIRAPQLVKQSTDDDLVDRAEEITRQDGGIADERMRAAIDEMQMTAAMLPYRRHEMLVKRGQRVVWLPHDLKYYEELPEPPDDDEHDDATTEDEPKQPRTQEVGPEDRKRILIEEGERARYEREVYRYPRSAWLAGGFYLIGGWFILCIILIQIASVADAAGASGLKEWFSKWSSRTIWIVAAFLVAYSAMAVVCLTPAVQSAARAAWFWAIRRLTWIRTRLTGLIRK